MRGLFGQGWSRLLAFCAVPAVLGALVFSGVQTFKASGAEENRSQTIKPPPASAKPSPPIPDSASTGAPPSQNTPPPAPPPDPRIARALETRVCLRAGKQSVWTALRRLGARLTWPDAGEPQWQVDDHAFDAGLRRLARRVEHWPQNARLIHQAGAFQAVAGRSGRQLDRAEARRQLDAALAQPEFRQSLDGTEPAKPRPITLSIPLREVAPTVNTTHLGGINTLLATYSTGLGGSSRNRRHNIRVACEAIDGTVLLPGDVFSYNSVVGPRSERAGFRTAPVIIRGELVPGTGGGICQVSTTLYNAALLADLRIVRRSHHQFPVHYVPPGRDATVAYGSLDLRFANSLPRPVALDVKEIGSRVIVRVFGAPECKRDVRLVNSRVQWTRPRVPAAGGPARPGKRVTVSRIVQLADGTVRREVISHDVYAPAPPSAHSGSTRHRRAGASRRMRRPRAAASPTPSRNPAVGTETAARENR